MKLSCRCPACHGSMTLAVLTATTRWRWYEYRCTGCRDIRTYTRPIHPKRTP